MVPSATLSPRQAVWVRALDRATAERIVVYRASATTLGVAAIVDGQWTEKPYTVAVTGPCACDVVCDCAGARNGRVCKHAAAATFARKHRVYAVQPVRHSATYREAMASLTGYDLPPSLQAARQGLR